MTPPLHLAVALDGAGWHPAAWRDPAARPAELFTAGYWIDLVREAERGLIDFVTIEDALGLQTSRPDDRTSAPTRCAAGSTRC
jgi:alkanesulfonate monooxygenase SsuD/methylene tetrahydromethanopterin reductase-like flavin-dependent oxidoreductase (luciferase family)